MKPRLTEEIVIAMSFFEAYDDNAAFMHYGKVLANALREAEKRILELEKTEDHPWVYNIG
jgi:hypothetical protein